MPPRLSISSPWQLSVGRVCLEKERNSAKNNISFAEGNIIKYVVRWKQKNGVEDLKKAKVYLDKLIELTEHNIAEARKPNNEGGSDDSNS